MRIDLQQFTKPCSCGRPHTIFVRGVWIEPGAIRRLPDLMLENRWERATVFCDENTRPIAGDPAARLLPGSSVACLPSRNLHANERGVALGREHLSGADVLVAAGSGTIHDITRFLAHENNLPFVSIPTAASVDGFVSTVAAMTWGGCKKTFPAVAPLYVLADSDIFPRAPLRLTVSGVCDLLGKHTALADWKISHLATGEYLCETICEMEYAAMDRVEKCLADIRAGTPEACEELMYGLLLSGLAMQMVGNSRPASGAEHHLSHLWEMECINPRIGALHGEKVGVGLLMAARKYHEAAARLRAGDRLPAAWNGLETELLRRHIPAGILPGILAENDPDLLAGLDLRAVERAVPAIVSVVDQIPGERRLEELMKAAGAKTSMEDLGLDPSLAVLSLRLSPYVRNRLTFMRLLKLWGLN